jgi:hypothetical protein
LRPYTQNCIETLSKSFLGQPISLPPEAQKAAIVSQSLQKNMIDGYLQCISAAIEDKKGKQVKEPFFALAIHRAITGYGLFFYRNFQIYSQAPKGFWLALHSLFQIADHYELLDQQITDPIFAKPPASSIQSAYLRIILLASAKVSQLSQKDIGAIFRAFADWAQLVKFNLGLSESAESFYCINLSKDFGASYKSRVSESEQDDIIIELDFGALLAQLSKQNKSTSSSISPSATIKIPLDVSNAALAHVIETLGNVALRKQERRAIEITADICIGLSDAHYFIGDREQFDQQVKNMTRGRQVEDTFLSGLTPNEAYHAEHPDAERPHYRVSVQNVSQGGYCLLWDGTTPIKVEGGDLISIKEFGKPNWNLGVVRWIRQRRSGSQLGVQLLSDKAKPAAIAQVYDMGGYSEYARALYLPPSRILDMPETLITPSIPFNEFDRVKVLIDNGDFAAKLDKCLFSTGHVQRYIYHALDGSDEAVNSRTENINDDDW